jgi:peptide/nickel transport system permease protein
MKSQNFWITSWKKLKKDKLAMTGLVLIGILFVIALCAPLIAGNKPYVYKTATKTYFPLFVDYIELQNTDFKSEKTKGFKIMPPIPYTSSEYNLDAILESPSKKHIMGTDDQGRDLASRMIHGTRVSILIGFIAVFIYVTIGIVIGAIAGYYGGIADMIISRIIEIVMCFPTLFLILTVIALIGTNKYVRIFDKSGLISIMVVIGITSWTGIARIVRGEFLKLREQDFVSASRSIGARDWRIIFKHILPNSMAPVFVTATFGIASTILIESSLSFLGFGVKPPTPSWGDILSQSRMYIDFAWWLTLIPGCAIFITITSYNLLGEGLRDVLDPKSVSKK